MVFVGGNVGSHPAAASKSNAKLYIARNISRGTTLVAVIVANTPEEAQRLSVQRRPDQSWVIIPDWMLLNPMKQINVNVNTNKPRVIAVI